MIRERTMNGLAHARSAGRHLGRRPSLTASQRVEIIEYENKDHQKLRSGRGGVWRISPSFDGAKWPLPRFTVLSDDELTKLHSFFRPLPTASSERLCQVAMP